MGITARIVRTASGVGAATVILALLSGCGSSDNGSNGAGPGNPGSAATVATSSGENGTFLVDASGQTLYFTDQDRAGSIACIDACAQIWLPLTVPDGTTPTAAAGLPADVGVVARPGGASQVTYDGKPLYTFTLDPQPGAVTGNGLSDEFGGTMFSWHAVFTEGGGSPTAAPSDGGYGRS